MLKYTAHIATLPMNASTNAAPFSTFHGRPAAVAPVMRIDSPSAMMTNRLHRSAMWVPSTFQSVVLERPSPGT